MIEVFRNIPLKCPLLKDLSKTQTGREDREGIQADARRGARPQSPREEIGAVGRLVQIRPGRQGIRVQNEADEQLLQLPQAFLRIPRRDQIHQAGSLCEFLSVPMVARQKARPQGRHIVHGFEGLRHA